MEIWKNDGLLAFSSQGINVNLLGCRAIDDSMYNYISENRLGGNANESFRIYDKNVWKRVHSIYRYLILLSASVFD